MGCRALGHSQEKKGLGFCLIARWMDGVRGKLVTCVYFVRFGIELAHTAAPVDIRFLFLFIPNDASYAKSVARK